MTNEIKKHLQYYGGSYKWVVNDLYNLTQEAQVMLDKGEAVNAEHAAYLVIDKRF